MSKCVACGKETDKGQIYDYAYDEVHDDEYGEFYCNECMERE